MPDAWVAPARYPLTVLHRPAEDELWVPVERREGDAVCRVCVAESGAQGTAEDAAGVLF